MNFNENLKFDSSQDWLTLLGWEYMELFYQLPCQVFLFFWVSWNADQFFAVQLANIRDHEESQHV